MRTAFKLIVLSVLLCSCSIDYNDTTKLEDAQMARQISLLQQALYSSNLRLEKVVTHHYDETFTCGKANGKQFMVRGEEVFVGHDEMTGIKISTCCITLSSHYRFGSKPGASGNFSRAEADESCAVLADLSNADHAGGRPAESTNALPSELQIRVTDYIRSQGLWCGKLVTFREKVFGSTVNTQVYWAFCDDGVNAQGYEISVRRGQFVSIEEA